MFTSRGLFGFTSYKDFFVTLFGLKTVVANTVVGALTTLIAFVAHNNLENVFTVKVIYGLIMVDWVLGTINAIRKRRFTSFKVFRAFLMIFLLSIILYFSWSLSSISVIFFGVPTFIIGGICVSYFVSLLEHIVDMNLLPHRANKVFKEAIDYLSVDRFIEKFKNRRKEDENEL